MPVGDSIVIEFEDGGYIADFSSKHDIIRTIVRWDLLPIGVVSWNSLDCELTAVLAVMLFFLSLVCVFTFVSLGSMRWRTHMA